MQCKDQQLQDSTLGNAPFQVAIFLPSCLYEAQSQIQYIENSLNSKWIVYWIYPCNYSTHLITLFLKYNKNII